MRRGAPHGRHCARCEKDVVDLTRVSAARAAAIALVFGRGGLCARVRADSDGFAVFDEARPPSRSPRVLAAALGVGVAACSGATPEARTECTPRTTIVTLPLPDAAPPSSAPPVESLHAAEVVDTDGDGIADDVDACPSVAAADTTDGCPRRVIVTTSGDIDIIQKVEFAAHQKTLDASDKIILDESAKVLAGNPQILKVEIEGHTDSTESPSLAKQRADVVIAYLVAKGVASGRLAAVSYGATRPLDTNATADGRARNRRIEFHILP